MASQSNDASGKDKKLAQWFSTVEYHMHLLYDQYRTKTYQEAIEAKNLLRGKTVLDFGAGSGVLSLFCAKAGAKRVYAIEQSEEMAAMVRAQVKENHLDDVIKVVQGRGEQIQLPEKVDAIVSEWMGNGILGEGMLPYVLAARDKWLKPEGLMYPNKITMFLAPCTDPQFYGGQESVLTSGRANYGISLEALLPEFRKMISSKAYIKGIRHENMKATPAAVTTLDLNTMSAADANAVEGNFDFTIVSDEKLHGLACWFDAMFPSGVNFSTGPYVFLGGWRQLLVYFQEPMSVKKGDKMKGSCRIDTTYSKDGEWGALNIIIKMRLNEAAETHHQWKLDSDWGQLDISIKYDHHV